MVELGRSKLKSKIYQVDAFANQLFSGNPAAICPLSSWIADNLMQKIAQENNLSETAFIVPAEDKKKEKKYDYEIRWFTPTEEVDLCGHATMAAAHVIFKDLKTNNSNKITFKTKSRGNLGLYIAA